MSDLFDVILAGITPEAKLHVRKQMRMDDYRHQKSLIKNYLIQNINDLY